MPRDINGNYTLPAGNPVVTGTTIASTWANSTLSDIATALTNSLSIDGSVTTDKIANDAVTPPKLNGLDVNGMVARISATEFEGRTITGTANKVSVTNGDGVSGDPTLTLPAIINQEGIQFPATQVPSGDANCLDDYEEGTWTPTLSFANPGNQSITYSVQVGTYNKIGKNVFIHSNVQTATFTHTTSSGVIIVQNMPFAANTTANSGPALAVSFFNNFTTAVTAFVPHAEVNNNATSYRLRRTTVTGGRTTTADVVESNHTTGDNIVLVASGTYLSAV